ncbi:sugar transferase [Vibrio profundum]|uniref:sugar transferase n=1 Tax=Vibrio profundum TaxID=2910247 RepID=UPI003D1340D8
MIRFFDIVGSLLGLILLFPIMMLVLFLSFLDSGSPIFVQVRVGKNKKPFNMIKFRTMNKNTPSMASHLSHRSSITKLGAYLRKTKIDETPQLINVLKGDMSLVGPRPNLFNQAVLMTEREVQGVYDVLPGITGLAQLKDIDMSTPKLLAEVDKEMLNNMSIRKYFGYIILTMCGKGAGDAVL